MMLQGPRCSFVQKIVITSAGLGIAFCSLMIPIAMAQATPPDIQQLINVLYTILIAVQSVIYIAIAIGWLLGLLMWSAPTKSIIVKKAGQTQMEMAGIGLFLALMGPAIFAFLIWIATQIVGPMIWS